MSEHGDVGYLTFDQFDRFRRAVHQAQIVVLNEIASSFRTNRSEEDR